MTVRSTASISIRGLHTLVTVPETSPRAVLIVRTPYGAGVHLAEAQEWARRGLAVVTQDVRGRHRSAGRFCPYSGEGADGLTTLEWTLDQSWCDAPVILYGTSYAAHCAVETAIAATAAGIEGIGGVSVAVPALGLGETARNVDGSFLLESRVGWWLEHGAGSISPGAAIPDGLLSTLPVTEIGRRVEPPITAWDAVLSAVRRDHQRAQQVCDIPWPLLAIGGTSDWFSQDTIDLWSSWGGPAAVVLGPWDHGLRGSGRARHMQAWIDGLLMNTPATGVYVHRPAGEVIRFGRWPDASRRIGLPGGSFHSDPSDPFPSVPPGTDLTTLAARSDCLVLDFPHDAGPIIGTPSVHVESGSGPGQWSALLAIRRRGGRLEQVAHGMSPRSTIHLTPTSTHLDTGESMAVILAAHSFPRFARDLHTGDDDLTGIDIKTARREVTGVVAAVPL